MDKFDESIKQAKHTYEPSSGFIDNTMQKVTGRTHRHHFNLKVWVPTLAGGLAVIALLFVALPIGNHANTATQQAKTTADNSNKSSQTASSSVPTPADGTDNATLASDLNGVNSEINQENSDQSSANSALNDSSQEVVVPTN